ncbi:replication factor A protein 1-like [Humulus lupulus]|uniref:replication factor A protein 1-like n=1 Tax=Humulus lupulus TaxID=3486 RepID=UPI002B40749F|nr:replication factor A protein 1-like [Humulus lupulus]
MEYSFLQDLDNDKGSLMIRVRVCRMWESINTKKNGELISLDMIFIDEKENLMHATIGKNLVTKLKHLLSEGCLYSIKNLKVVASTGEYKPLSNENKLLFLVTTSLKKLEEGIVKIPINGFQFISQSLIDLRVNDNTILSDVVGCLCGVGDIEIVGGNWKKRDIKIITNYSVTTKITLWGDLGEMFDREVIFSTTSATKIYINLEIDYVTSLIERFSTTSNRVQDIESSNVNRLSLEEEMFLNRLSIKEMLEANLGDQVKECIVTIRCKIIGIDNTFGWYKIHIRVMDKTGETTFVLFNVIAEKLLDTSAHKLFNRLSSNNNLPTEIETLCGKDFVYKLRLNEYNLKEGLENFTVSKIFVPNEKLEQEHESKKVKKEKFTTNDGDEKLRVTKENHSQDVGHHDFGDSVEDYGLTVQSGKRKKHVVVDDEDDD